MADSEAATNDAIEPFDADFQRRLQRLVLVARRSGGGRPLGQHPGTRAGSGIAFAEHRAYAPGDDFRHIDWHAFGRLRRLLIRRFEQEEDLSVWLLVDRSASMGVGAPPKLRQAKRVAAALAYLSLSRLDRVSVVGLGGAQPTLPPGRGRGHIFRVLDFLRQLPCEGRTDLATSLGQVAAGRRTGGLAVVLSDMFDPAGFARGLDALRFAKCDVIVVHVTDAADAELPELGALCLRDAETGVHRTLTMTRGLAERYVRRYRAHLASVERHCGQHGMLWCPVPANAPVDEAVLALIRRRGVAAQ